MFPGHLLRSGHRQEMQIQKDMKGIVGFNSFGSRGWGLNRSRKRVEGRGKGQQRETRGKLGSRKGSRERQREKER